jgi:hypothetical protein
MTEIPNHQYRLLMPVINMKDLKDGAYYIGKSYQRGMPIGLWDGMKKKFQCIKPPEFGRFSLYEMNHIEEDDGFVCFEPVVKIEL